MGNEFYNNNIYYNGITDIPETMILCTADDVYCTGLFHSGVIRLHIMTRTTTV